MTLPELVAGWVGGRGPALDHIPGLTWQSAGGTTRNPDRCIAATDNGYLLPYEKLGAPRRYLARTYLGNRTVAHQVAPGCRFHSPFCGLAAMFGCATHLPASPRPPPPPPH